MDFFDWIKSTAAESSNQREKYGHDRIRARIIKERLEEILEMPYCTFISMKDLNRLQYYMKRIIGEVDRFTPVSFDVSGIDRIVLGIAEVMKYAKGNGGSLQTLERCLTGIAFGVGPGHSEIPSEADLADRVACRKNLLDHYRNAALLSLEIDNCRMGIIKRRAEKRKKEEALHTLKQKLEERSADSPAVYQKISGMTPQEREALTGEEEIIASGIRSCEAAERELARIKKDYEEAQKELSAFQASLDDLTALIEQLEKDVEGYGDENPAAVKVSDQEGTESAPNSSMSDEGRKYLDQYMEKEGRFYDSPGELSETIVMMELQARKTGKGNLPGWKMRDIHRYVEDNWAAYR